MNAAKKLFMSLITVTTLILPITLDEPYIVVNAQEVPSVEINPQNYIGYGCVNGEDLKENINGNEINTIPESLTGFGCSSSCGASRENGYSSAYESGCRNWQIMPIISPLYKYWIDESSLAGLTDSQKNTFITNVDNAVKEWNSVRLADYDGPIVNLQKCSTNGIDVVPIRYSPSLSGAIGQFNPVPLLHEIKIKYYNDYDTIMHELGHMIGLQDLDMNNDPWTHISLMGYAGDDDLHYQDIQGLAVANNKHIFHDYRRYWYKNGIYTYVCFYCDASDFVLTSWSGGSHLVESASCAHEYEFLAKSQDKHWYKCTKCYKVETSTHAYTHSYEQVNASKHNEYCVCGNFTVNYHDFEFCRCTKCNYFKGHSYDYSYSWVSYTNHYGYCHCDEFQLQGHAVASGSYNTGQRFATCLLCGGSAEMGFVQLTINSSAVTKVTINGSFILPNGVIVLEDEDLEAYLNGTLVFYDKDKVPVLQ